MRAPVPILMMDAYLARRMRKRKKKLDHVDDEEEEEKDDVRKVVLASLARSEQ